MRTTVLTVAGALTLVHGVATAQGSWGSVKAWTGTATIEATETGTGRLNSTLTYKATGDFTISDDALGDGDHMMWPMPDPESADPAKVAAAYQPWQARVVATYEASGVSLEGGKVSVKCTADNQKAERLGVMTGPSKPEYIFSVAVPEALFECTGDTDYAPSKWVYQTGLQVNGPRGEPGPVSGTKTFTEAGRVIKVSFTMKPAR